MRGPEYYTRSRLLGKTILYNAQIIMQSHRLLYKAPTTIQGPEYYARPRLLCKAHEYYTGPSLLGKTRILYKAQITMQGPHYYARPSLLYKASDFWALGLTMGPGHVHRRGAGLCPGACPIGRLQCPTLCQTLVPKNGEKPFVFV